MDRTQILEKQPRCFITGTVENIYGQWVFFDEETEEASPIEKFLHQEIEVLQYNRWRRGILLDNNLLSFGTEMYYFRQEEKIRVRKQVFYSLEQLMNDINDDAFIQFITSLNALNFSIFDCIYCYNHLKFLENAPRKTGANFIIFDNEELICSVTHHFNYYEKQHDRFEYTLNTGKRMVIEKINNI